MANGGMALSVSKDYGNTVAKPGRSRTSYKGLFRIGSHTASAAPQARAGIQQKAAGPLLLMFRQGLPGLRPSNSLQMPPPTIKNICRLAPMFLLTTNRNNSKCKNC